VGGRPLLGRLIAGSLRFRKGAAASLLVGLMAIQVGLAGGLCAIRGTRVAVQQNLLEHSRGAFDILVRPSSTVGAIEPELGLVESHYIAACPGGITMDQWRDIRSIPDVEVAAPVAALGFFSNSSDSVNVQLPSGSFHVTARFLTSDGVRSYLIQEGEAAFLLSGKANKASERYVYLSSHTVSRHSGEHGSVFAFQLPAVYCFLVAIDPASEGVLTGIDRCLTWGTYISSRPLEQVVLDQVVDERGQPKDIKASEIPVLVNTAIPVPLTVEVAVERLEVSPGQLLAIPRHPIAGKPITKAVGELARSATVLETRHWSYDLRHYLRPFQTISLNVEEDGTAQPTLDCSYQIAPASEYFITRGISYDVLSQGAELILKPLPKGVRDGQVLFHELVAQGRPYMERVAAGDDIFVLRPVGGVDFTGPIQDELARSPLGIYAPDELLLTTDAAGRPLTPPARLMPTGTPGTIHVPGAHGLTTLEAARLLKGEAPIDAVRVRVKGSGPYNAVIEQRVRRVAEEIAVNTGLRVDIVAGASPRMATLIIPGFGDVAPLGAAQCQLTSLGVMAQVRRTFEWLAALLSAAFLLVSTAFGANRARLLLEQRREEFKTLAWQGWGRLQIGGLVAGEAGVLWCLAGAGAAGVVRLVPFGEMAMPFWAGVFVFGGVVFAGAAYALATRPERRPGGRGRGRTGPPSAGRGRGDGPRGPAGGPPGSVPTARGLLRADLTYYSRQLLAVAGQLALGSGLFVFACLLWSAATGRIAVTRLGAYTASSAAPYLIMVAGASAAVAVLTCVDAVTAYLEARRDHYQVLNDGGWSWPRLCRLAIVESVLPAAAGSLTGVALAALCVRAIDVQAGFPWLAPVAVATGLPALAAATTGWWFMTMGRSARSTLRKRFALAGGAAAAAACLIIAVVALGIRGAGRPAAVAGGEGAAASLDARAAAAETYELVKRLCAAGSRPNGSDADRAEVDFLCRELERAGLAPRREAVKVPPLLVVSPGASLTIGGSERGFNFLAVDLVAIGARQGHVISDQRPMRWSTGADAQQAAGRIVLVEASDRSLVPFAGEVARIRAGGPKAVIGLELGVAPDGPLGSAELRFELVQLHGGYETEALVVDVPGVEPGPPSLWVLAGHGATSAGAGENAGAAATALVLARHMARTPPPAAVRFIWLPACSGQFLMGASEYLARNTPPAALVLDGVGGPDPLIFGRRSDIAFGRPYMESRVAGDVEQKDYVRLMPSVDWLNGVLDLGRPGTLAFDSADTPDDWMLLANRVAYRMGLDIRPSTGMGLARTVGKFCPRTAEIYREALYVTTVKDTPERLDAAALGRDAAFADALIRELVGGESR